MKFANHLAIENSPAKMDNQSKFSHTSKSGHSRNSDGHSEIHDRSRNSNDHSKLHDHSLKFCSLKEKMPKIVETPSVEVSRNSSPLVNQILHTQEAQLNEKSEEKEQATSTGLKQEKDCKNESVEHKPNANKAEDHEKAEQESPFQHKLAPISDEKASFGPSPNVAKVARSQSVVAPFTSELIDQAQLQCSLRRQSSDSGLSNHMNNSMKDLSFKANRRPSLLRTATNTLFAKIRSGSIRIYPRSTKNSIETAIYEDCSMCRNEETKNSESAENNQVVESKRDIKDVNAVKIEDSRQSDICQSAEYRAEEPQKLCPRHARHVAQSQDMFNSPNSTPTTTLIKSNQLVHPRTSSGNRRNTVNKKKRVIKNTTHIPKASVRKSRHTSRIALNGRHSVSSKKHLLSLQSRLQICFFAFSKSKFASIVVQHLPVLVNTMMTISSGFRALWLVIVLMKRIQAGNLSCTDEVLFAVPVILMTTSAMVVILHWKKVQEPALSRRVNTSQTKFSKMMWALIISYAVILIAARYVRCGGTASRTVVTITWFIQNIIPAIWVIIYVMLSIPLVYKLVNRLRNFDFDTDARQFVKRISVFLMIGTVLSLAMISILVVYSLSRGNTKGEIIYTRWMWVFRILEAAITASLLYLVAPHKSKKKPAQSTKQRGTFISWSQSSRVSEEPSPVCES